MTDVYDPTDLTPEQVSGLTNQQLNDVAAQLVMEWEYQPPEWGIRRHGHWCGEVRKGEVVFIVRYNPVHFEATFEGFSPSTDLNHAAMLTERMRERGWGTVLIEWANQRTTWRVGTLSDAHPDAAQYTESPSRSRAETEANVLAALWEREQEQTRAD